MKGGTNISLDTSLRLQGDDSNVAPTKDTSKLTDMNTVMFKFSKRTYFNMKI